MQSTTDAAMGDERYAYEGSATPRRQFLFSAISPPSCENGSRRQSGNTAAADHSNAITFRMKSNREMSIPWSLQAPMAWANPKYITGC